jgi:hypothetical protein
MEAVFGNDYKFIAQRDKRRAIAYATTAGKPLKAQPAESEKQIETLQTQLEVFKRIHKME